MPKAMIVTFEWVSSRMGSLFVHKLKPKERFGLNLVFDRKVTGFTYARHLKTACFDGFSIFVFCTYVRDVVWWTFRYNQLLQFVLLAVEKFWLCGMIHLASIYVKPYLMFVYECFRVCMDECVCERYNMRNGQRVLKYGMVVGYRIFSYYLYFQTI